MGTEEQKKIILRFMADRFLDFGDEYISHKEISENCDMDENDVKKICTNLEVEGFVQNSNVGKSHKITTNGLILLESYSSGSGSGPKFSQINDVVKRGLFKIKMSNPEVEAGVVEAGRKYHLRDGLFYVVLIDLAGSTLASSKMSSSVFNKWIKNFLSITKDSLNAKQRNLTVFVKFIGDGALFLFRNFDDILDWKNNVDDWCSRHNDRCKKEGKLDFYQYHHKTIIHLSEVYFDQKDSEVNAFGVNVVFKIEKKFARSEIGITDTVRQVIIQDINSGKFRIDNADCYSPDEDEGYKIPLWKLVHVQ